MKRIFTRILHFFLPGSNLKTLLLSALHGLWMIAFSLIWMVQVNMFDGFDFMSSVMDYRDLIKKDVLNIQNENDLSEHFLLINSSKSNSILPLDNDNLANSVITDRRKLAETLFVLDSHAADIRFVIVDIFFESPSADTVGDSLLQEALTRLDRKNKVIIPEVYLEESGEMISPVFSAAGGTSQYKSAFMNEQFLKFSCIYHDSVKQMVVKAWEKISGERMEAHRFGPLKYYTIGGKWCMNTMIPGFRYTPADLVENETYYQMGYFSEYFIGKDQVVIIGDFEGIYDSHHSMMDKVPGPLAMMNAYLAIAHHDHVLSWYYLLILFLAFTYITYHSFYQNRISYSGQRFKKLGVVLRFLRNNMNFIMIFVLALVSMLFFHFYIHLLILLTYFGVIEFLMFRYRDWRKRRQEKRRALRAQQQN